MAFLHKYNAEIAENIAEGCECPSPLAIEILEPISACRFAFDPLDGKSFTPTGVVNSSICEGKNSDACCSYHGLSMYANAAKARKAFKYYCSMQADFPRTVGSYLAYGKLMPGDGLVTHPNRRSSHFTLHENQNCNLPPQFSVSEELKCN